MTDYGNRINIQERGGELVARGEITQQQLNKSLEIYDETGSMEAVNRYMKDSGAKPKFDPILESEKQRRKNAQDNMPGKGGKGNYIPSGIKKMPTISREMKSGGFAKGSVDKRITGVKENVSVIEDDISLNIEDGDIINRPNADEEIDIEETEDGGALVDFDPSAPNLEAGFADNLAEVLNEKTLRTIASDLVGEFDSDHESRHEWEFAYTKGLDLLGFKYNERSEPFQGASGVTHPLLAESVTAFQAQAFKELLPPSGPVKTQVLGAETPEIIAQADRVQDFMNYQITDKMQEYTPDMDQLLFHLPLAGSAFKKVYYDATRQSAVSKFIPSEDLVVNYLATDLCR